MIRFNCPHCGRPYELHPALARLPLLCKQCGQPITPPDADPEPPPPPKPVAAPKPAPPVAAAAPPKPAPDAPPPAPPPAVAKPPAKAPPAPVTPAAKAEPPLAEEEDEDDGLLVAKPDDGPDIDFNVGGPTAASLSEASRARPAGLSDATRPRSADFDTAPEVAPPTAPVAVAAVAPPPPPPKPQRAPRPPAAPKPAPRPKAGSALLPFLADAFVFVLLLTGGMILGEAVANKSTGEVLSGLGSAPKFPPVELLTWGGPPLVFALLYLLLNSRGRTLGAWLRGKN